MGRSIVIGYGTRRGSTREVAEAVAEVLQERGFSVELLKARELKDVALYDGVILGGALYRGRWHPDARRVLKRQRKALAAMPVAVFGMGPRKGGEERLQRSRAQLEGALAKVPQVEPVLTGCFGGVDRKRKVDLRDRDAIRAWAEEAATAFEPAAAVEPPAQGS